MFRPRQLVPMPVAVLATVVAFTLIGPVASPAQDKPATSNPSAQDKPATSNPPAQAVPSNPAAAPSTDTKSTQPGDPFGEEVTLSSKPMVYFKGSGNWDSAFETIVDGFKSVNGFLTKAGIKPDGQPMTIYTSTDDNGFQFEAAIPVAEAPKDPPKGDIAVGTTPTGKAYKFVHRGSYDSMDTTYEAITNFLDEKGADAKELFVEQYVTDPIATPEDKLVVEIYVPVK
jgi:effector-binding domain-containing protein